MQRQQSSSNSSTRLDKNWRRVRLKIEFDGTDFCGWAEQPGLRTVKGTLKSSIHRVTGEEVDLRGASRTDSGAHALGFVADFATQNAMPAENWTVAVNAQLPDDIRIAEASFAPWEFHSRFFARSRTYEYRIAESYKVEPSKARFVHADGRRIDLESASQALEAIIGWRDFRAFGEELEGLENPVREVKRATLRRIGSEVRLRVEATAFIRGMMRRIAGGLFEVGIGKRSIEDFANLLDLKKRERLKWPVVLPAKGLCLLRVSYGSTLRDLRDLKKENNETE